MKKQSNKIKNQSNKLKIKILTYIILFITLGSCTQQQPSHNAQVSRSVTGNCTVLADSIIYDVLLAPSDSTNSWENYCLSGIHQQKLIDYIFDGIYSGRFKAYDFINDKELKIKDIRKIEKSEGYSRDLITKIQFREAWHVDSAGVFNKRIIGLTLGIAKFSSQRTFLGHSALLRVEMDSQQP